MLRQLLGTDFIIEKTTHPKVSLLAAATLLYRHLTSDDAVKLFATPGKYRISINLIKDED